MAGAYCPCTLACIVVTAPPLDRPLRARVNEINKVVAFLELRNAVEDGQIRKPQVKMLGHNYSGPEVCLFVELALWLLAGRPPDKEPVHGYELFWQGRRKSVCKCLAGYREESHSLGISSEWAVRWGTGLSPGAPPPDHRSDCWTLKNSVKGSVPNLVLKSVYCSLRGPEFDSQHCSHTRGS